MKKKPRSSGTGKDVIDNLVHAIAARDGISVVKKSKGLELSIPGKRKTEFVSYEPAHHRRWVTRLARVEKQAALCLLGGPILYRIKFTGRGEKKGPKRVLRLSVGLSLSLGSSLPKRYTCVLRSGQKRALVTENGHLQLGQHWGKSALTLIPDWVEAEISGLALAVIEACENFAARPEVEEAIATLGEQKRVDFNHLDGLYRRNQGSNERLYGLPTIGADGSNSIESEHRGLQRIILEHFVVKVRVRILSLGVLEGAIPRQV